jgi:hypothetical protein
LFGCKYVDAWAHTHGHDFHFDSTVSHTVEHVNLSENRNVWHFVFLHTIKIKFYIENSIPHLLHYLKPNLLQDRAEVHLVVVFEVNKSQVSLKPHWSWSFCLWLASCHLLCPSLLVLHEAIHIQSGMFVFWSAFTLFRHACEVQ